MLKPAVGLSSKKPTASAGAGTKASNITGLMFLQKMGKKPKNKKQQSPQTPVTPATDVLDSEANKEEPVESADLEMEFELTMLPVLNECSRQKLRAFQMVLLKYGSNEDERIQAKDLPNVFQEAGIKLPSRAHQLIVDVYEDGRGIDYQKFYKRLERAQAKTGRDSVLARQSIGDRSYYNQITEEAKDMDYLKRLEKQMIKCSHYFDLEVYKKACQERDISKTGKLAREQMEELARLHTLPIYGALLTALLKRCDDEKNGYVSWPEFMNFLLMAYNNYTKNNPNKPRLGSNKPQLDQGSLTKAKLTEFIGAANPKLDNSVNRAGDLVKEFSSRIKTSQKAGNNLERRSSTSRRKSVSNRRPSHTLQEAAAILPALSTSQTTDDSRIPTKQFTIQGQVMKLVKPDEFKNESGKGHGDPPTQRLKLSWVYGFNGRTSKKNLHIISSRELLYTVGHIAVILNIEQENHKQRHYKEHTAYITCLTVKSDGIIIASGQSKFGTTLAQIRIWRSDSLQTVCVLEDKTTPVLAVTNLSFCKPQGRGLLDSGSSSCHDCLAVGELRDQVYLSIWNIKDRQKLCESKLDTTQLCDVDFNPCYPDMLVSLGKEYFQWWRVNRDTSSLDLHMQPEFGLHMKARYYNTCVHTAEGELITADSNGTVYVWKAGSNVIINIIKHAHEGGVRSLLLVDNTLITCGRDDIMNFWKFGYHIDNIQSVCLPNGDGNITSLVYDKDKLFLGSSANTVMTFVLEFNTQGHLCELSFITSPFAQGPSGKITGLKTLVSPQRSNYFLVSGSSGSIVLYDSSVKQAIGRALVKVQITSTDTINGDSLYIGTEDGRVLIYSCHEGFKLYLTSDIKLCKSPITVISCSPNGCYLATASSRIIYLLYEEKTTADGSEELKIEWKIKGQFTVPVSAGSVTLLDWSLELYMRSYLLRVYCSKSLYLALWNTWDLTQVKSLEPYKTCKWSNRSCPLSYPIAGVWYSKQCKENGLDSLHVNKDQTLIAVTDKHGYICLFQYPCINEGAFCHTYKSHTEPGFMLFSPDNHSLLTTGINDGIIMQWTVV